MRSANASPRRIVVGEGDFGRAATTISAGSATVVSRAQTPARLPHEPLDEPSGRRRRTAARPRCHRGRERLLQPAIWKNAMPKMIGARSQGIGDAPHEHGQGLGHAASFTALLPGASGGESLWGAALSPPASATSTPAAGQTPSLRNVPGTADIRCSHGAGTAKPSDQPHRLRRTELRSVRCASALTSVISGVSPMGYSVAMGPAALSAPYSRSS